MTKFGPSRLNRDQVRDCAIIIRRGGGGAEKLELSSKNVDSTPLQNKKKLVLTPLCYVKNNVAPPSHHPPTHTHPPLTATITIDDFK